MKWKVKPGIGNKAHLWHQTWQRDELGLGSVQRVQSGAKGDRTRGRTGNKATVGVQSSSRSWDQRQGLGITYNRHTRGPSKRQGTYSILLHTDSNGSRSTSSETVTKLTKEQEIEQAIRRLAPQMPSLLPDTLETKRNCNNAAIHKQLLVLSDTLIHFTHLIATIKPLSSPLTSCMRTGGSNTPTKIMLP